MAKVPNFLPPSADLANVRTFQDLRDRSVEHTKNHDQYLNNYLNQNLLPAVNGGTSLPAGGGGGLPGGVVTVTQSPFTVSPEPNQFIPVDASGGVVEIDLPAATGSGDVVSVKKMDATPNQVAVTPSGTDTIDGATGPDNITFQYKSFSYIDFTPGAWASFILLAALLFGGSAQASYNPQNGNFNGRITDVGVPDPAAPVATPVNPGSTSVSYFLVCHDSNGGVTNVSPVDTITNSPTTLNATSYNSVAWMLPLGAVNCDLLKGDTAHSATGGLGLTASPFKDVTNATVAYATPTRNSTADMINPTGIDNPANILIEPTPSYLPNPVAWTQSMSQMDWVLSGAGDATIGSANQFGLNIQGGIPGPTNSAAAYEKGGLLVVEQTNDPSDGATITRDAVGADIEGWIAATNPLGRAFGSNPRCLVLAGGDGLCTGEEIDVVNDGTDQGTLATTTSKYGLTVISQGSQPVTAGILLEPSPSTFHVGLFIDQSAIDSSGGAFVNFGFGAGHTLLSVGEDGGMIMGTTGNPPPSDEGPGTINIYNPYYNRDMAGVTCASVSAATMTTMGGIVTHC